MIWNEMVLRTFLMEMKWQLISSLQLKILYTCENNKKNNEKQNSENSVPAFWKMH